MPRAPLTPEDLVDWLAGVALALFAREPQDLDRWLEHGLEEYVVAGLRAARAEDRERLRQEARDAGATYAGAYGSAVDLYLAFKATLRPPGLPKHLADRKSGRRRAMRKPKPTARDPLRRYSAGG